MSHDINNRQQGKTKAFKFRGQYLIIFVSLVYLLLFFYNQEEAMHALQKSFKVLAKIIPIITVIIFFTALLNYFLQPKKIAKHLGKNAGIKGWLWSLAGGVISHGPLYAWFPLLEDLRSHGMRDGLLVVFIYSRAIKLPILPIMIDYFGWQFTLVLSIYILLGSIVQGLLLEFFSKKQHS